MGYAQACLDAVLCAAPHRVFIRRSGEVAHVDMGCGKGPVSPSAGQAATSSAS